MSKSLKQVLMLFVLINITGLLACDRTVFPGFGGRFSPEPVYRAASPGFLSSSNNPFLEPGCLRPSADDIRQLAKIDAARLSAQASKAAKSGS